ncbi:hypothetical protein GCM10007162_08840 [Ignatzschineria ureiclastica]|nr:hypothetical protein GCM10007162_08840 [Ignatzschineria ureiclastica]
MVNSSQGILENSENYSNQVTFNSVQGHGFAAEQANNLWDRLTGKSAKIVGGNNAKNGADRLVDGQLIQTKYCSTASSSVAECFSKGIFRYSGMQIEVPADQYEHAIQLFKSRISQGQVPDVTDPEQASNIIRKGNFTYEQVKNIAKAGAVEGIVFDATNSMIVAKNSMGISASISFAVSIWNGEDWRVALKQACYEGLKTGGTAWIGGIFASQLGRTGLDVALRSSTDWIVKQLGAKNAATFTNALRSGSNIYGASAMNQMSKLLRGNIITGAVTTLILSSGDFIDLFRNRMSGAQVFKNLTNTTATVAGGMAGAVASGMAIGSAIPIPLLGTILGGIIGGTLAGKASSAIMDQLIEDDSVQMIKIIEEQLGYLAENYLLTANEADIVIAKIIDQQDNLPIFLKDMYQSENRDAFAYLSFEPIFSEVVAEREYVKVPGNGVVKKETKNLLRRIGKNKPIDLSRPDNKIDSAIEEFVTIFNLSLKKRIGRIRYVNSILGAILLALGVSALTACILKHFLDIKPIDVFGLSLLFVGFPILGIFFYKSTVLRLHDLNLSAWILLLLLIPVPLVHIIFGGGLILLPGKGMQEKYGGEPDRGFWRLTIILALTNVILFFGLMIFFIKISS